MECKVCFESNFNVVNTYKHIWHVCKACDSAERIKKDKYFFEYFIPKGYKKLPGFFNYLLPSSYFDESKEATSYHYYADMGSSNEWKFNKWLGETNIVLERFKKFGIDITGKSVLDISGGPGFVANNLRTQTSYILLTEFSQIAVEGMRKF